MRDELAQRLIDHVVSVDVDLYSPDELHVLHCRRVLNAMRDGRFGEALPQAMVEDIYSYAAEQMAVGQDHVGVALKADAGGLIVFAYRLTGHPEQIDIGPALDFHVPDDPRLKRIPGRLGDLPILVMNVGRL